VAITQAIYFRRFANGERATKITAWDYLLAGRELAQQLSDCAPMNPFWIATGLYALDHAELIPHQGTNFRGTKLVQGLL
jgi:hypothetical protein